MVVNKEVQVSIIWLANEISISQQTSFKGVVKSFSLESMEHCG